jgi:hypothetical protein
MAVLGVVAKFESAFTESRTHKDSHRTNHIALRANRSREL